MNSFHIAYKNCDHKTCFEIAAKWFCVTDGFNEITYVRYLIMNLYDLHLPVDTEKVSVQMIYDLCYLEESRESHANVFIWVTF